MEYILAWLKYNGEYVINYHTVFTTKNVRISMRDYIKRMDYYEKYNNQIYVIACIYLQRIERDHTYVVNSFTCHKLVLISLRIATKYWDDISSSNKRYASLGGISLEEMNTLEISFLRMITFDLYFTEQEYNSMNDYLDSLL